MDCSLNRVVADITGAITALVAAIALAALWVAAIPLFAAAVLVASVSLYFIPHIKQELLEYMRCRGPGECATSIAINNLGQAAAVLSIVSFAVAGAMQVTALAFIFSWFLAAIGIAMQAAVGILVASGVTSCAVVVFILLGVLSNAWSYKKCMDESRVISPVRRD